MLRHLRRVLDHEKERGIFGALTMARGKAPKKSNKADRMKSAKQKPMPSRSMGRGRGKGGKKK
jgi:hypothetical protein